MSLDLRNRRIQLARGVYRGRRGLVNWAQNSAFNPLTSWTTDPVHGVWASDPLWTPPADGGAVSAWRNGGSVGGDLVQATGSKQPTYRASTAAYNNQPTVQFDGTDDYLGVNITDVSAPYYVLLVANITGAASQLVCGFGYETYNGIGQHGAWFLAAGAPAWGGTPNGNPHLWNAKIVVGAGDSLAIDGTTVVSASTGERAIMWLSLGAATTLGASPGLYLSGHIAYCAVFNTDPTALPEWATFKAWVTSFYGITVA